MKLKLINSIRKCYKSEKSDSNIIINDDEATALQLNTMLAEKLLKECPKRENRYFQHFKGGKYRFVCTAFDSETTERLVVYQALYGDNKCWVRPEKMFFENIVRDGRKFARFTEIDID